MIKFITCFIIMTMVGFVCIFIDITVDAFKYRKRCNNGVCPICNTKFRIKDVTYSETGKGACTCYKCGYECHELEKY